jgi:hypothetical protein
MRLTPLALAAALLAAPALAEDPARPSEADAKLKVEAYTTAVKNKSDEEKASAIAAMSDCPHPLVTSTLGKILVVESDELRIAAAGALGRMPSSADAAKACHGAIKANAERTKVVEAVFRAMSDINHPSSVAVAKEWGSEDLGSRDTEDLPTIRGAIECLGAMKWKSAVEAVLDIWRKNRVSGRDRGSNFRERVRKYCASAFQQLVAERGLGSYEEADDFWKDNAKKFNDDMSTR